MIFPFCHLSTENTSWSLTVATEPLTNFSSNKIMKYIHNVPGRIEELLVRREEKGKKEFTRTKRA